MTTQRLTLTLILVLALLAPGASLAQPTAAPGAMLIVENAGQWPAAARFQVWNSPLGPGTTWLAEDAIWITVPQVSGSEIRGAEGHEVPQRSGVEKSAPHFDLASPVRSAEGPPDLRSLTSDPLTSDPLPSALTALKLTFPGSNPDVRIEPFDPLTTTVSYFIGNDPEQWRPDVPVWGGVRYVGLYHGVDLVIGGPDGAWQLEASSGAAVEQMRVQVEGADIVGVDGVALQLSVAGESLSIDLPSASFGYEAMGVSQQDVPQVMAVRSAPRNRTPAVPSAHSAALRYGTYLGSDVGDFGRAVAVDRTDGVYVVGDTGSFRFPTTPGAFDTGLGGNRDAFVIKLDPTGSALAYGTFLGGSNDDVGFAIALEQAGNAYVTGYTMSSDFPTTASAFDTSYNGSGDAFVVKLDPSGSALAYGTFLGGNDWENGNDIAVDEAGNAYVIGDTKSGGFPTTPGAFDTSYGGGAYDSFVIKLNSVGSALTYATFLGGSDYDAGSAIAVDEVGGAYVTGKTYSSDFPTTPGALNTIYGGPGIPFVVRFSPTGSALVYSTFLGGSDYDYTYAIAVDEAGNAYVTGFTWSSDFPTTPDAFSTSFNGGDCDAFVVKLNPDGSNLAYATFLGGGSGEWSLAIAVDRAGSAYVTGWTNSDDFPTTLDAFDTSINGDYDVFVVKLNPDGSALIYATFVGGRQGDAGCAITFDAANNTYVTGWTYSSDFPTTPEAFDPSFNGGADAFVVKLSLDPYTSNVIAPIEQPVPGAFVSGIVTLRGFAIDLGSAAGAGIDMVHIYLDGPYGTGTIIGGATYGLDRPDVAAQYGARFGPSGWELVWDTNGVAPGVHRLYLYAHRTTDSAWSLMEPHLVVIRAGCLTWLPVASRH